MPSGEPAVSGFVDLGYRWVTGVGGNEDTYRSVIDLASGVRLLSTEFTILDTTKHWFDSLNVRAYNWGDPYATLHLDVRRAKLYSFSADYRNIAYYNNLPSFADPALGTGLVLDEQSLDTHQRIASFLLEFFPGRKITPYLQFDSDTNTGNGVSTFVSNGDEFPVHNLARNSTANYRAGLRGEFSRFHWRIEQGGTTFKDDEQMNQASGQTNYGNFLAPVIGQTLDLTSLGEAWGVRGHSVYSSASVSANVASWIDLQGQFLYSEPVSSVNFQEHDTGNQVLLSQILFYTGEQSLISSAAKEPHTSGSLGAEIRPMRRLRLVPLWLTDRMHTSGSSLLEQTLVPAGSSVAIPSPNSELANSTLVNDYNQAGMEVQYDLLHSLTLRAGYRYVWGDASTVVLPLEGLAGLEEGKIRRNVALAGLSWHPLAKAWVNADYEQGSSGSAYFATSLYDYQKGHLRGREQISKSLSISASANVLHNTNPSGTFSYAFLAHQESASILYAPGGGKLWDFEGSYTRATLRSDATYYDPEFLIPARSLYRDNSHTVTALFDFNLPGREGLRSKISLGGSAFLSSGSNPTVFYQPVAKLFVPLSKKLAWFAEWRSYQFDQSFYLYQSFRTQMVTTGVRLSR